MLYVPSAGSEFWQGSDPSQLLKVDFPLGARTGKKVAKRKNVSAFLAKNPLAKIVIVIDTHSCEDGTLVCGEEKGFIYSDVLGQVGVRASS